MRNETIKHIVKYTLTALSLCTLYTVKAKHIVTVWRMCAGPQAVWSQMRMTVWSTELGAVGGPTTPVPGAFHYLHIAAVWPSHLSKLVSSLTTATEFSGMAKNNVLKIIMMHINWFAFRCSVPSWGRKGTWQSNGMLNTNKSHVRVHRLLVP